jgi:ATP-dependent protease ClpP protease subunit
MPDQPRQWYEMVRAEAGNTATIRIFGDIGDSWFGDSVSAASFAKDLDEIGPVGTLNLHVNSPGGDMFDGVAIFNTLRGHQARKVVHIDGLAASAASVIAMAGDEIVMGTGTQLMIHNAWAMVMGDSEDMRKQAAVMDGLNESMAGIYADRAGGETSTWRAAMNEETWYLPEEAVAAGLADRVVRRESESETDNTAVAAMLRRSRVAAKYRYQGRAHAPAPRTPVHAGGSQTEGGFVEITDEDFANLRTKLGLDDSAEIGDVLDALEEGAAGEEEREPVAAKLPDGVLAVDKATWAQVQDDARLGREARQAQVQARRVAKIDAAIAAGKIVPARRDHWLAQIEGDEDGITAVLEGLTAVFGTTEVGHDDGSVTTPNTLEGVRASADYQGWKVI